MMEKYHENHNIDIPLEGLAAQWRIEHQGSKSDAGELASWPRMPHANISKRIWSKMAPALHSTRRLMRKLPSTAPAVPTQGSIESCPATSTRPPASAGSLPAGITGGRRADGRNAASAWPAGRAHPVFFFFAFYAAAVAVAASQGDGSPTRARFAVQLLQGPSAARILPKGPGRCAPTRATICGSRSTEALPRGRTWGSSHCTPTRISGFCKALPLTACTSRRSATPL